MGTNTLKNTKCSSERKAENNFHSLFTHHINHLKPTRYVMHQQLNIQQLYVLPTMYVGYS